MPIVSLIISEKCRQEDGSYVIIRNHHKISSQHKEVVAYVGGIKDIFIEFILSQFDSVYYLDHSGNKQYIIDDVKPVKDIEDD